jgi:hypothetical protein
MEKHDTELLRAIDDYRQDHNLSESRFGRVAMRDPAFLSEFRRGRQLQKKTVQRLRRFLRKERFA